MIGQFGIFGYADEAWMPTLLDIERLKAEGTDAQKAYFGKFGFDQLEIPATDVNIKSRVEKLNTRFIARYGTRMIGHETMEIWQTRLQERFDAVADKYERAYALYEKYKVQMMDDALPGITTTVSGTNTAGGSDTISGKAKFSDTPDSSINDSDEFAGSINKNVTTYGRKDTVASETKQVYTGGQIMDAVNKTIEGWRDVDTDFIAEFENLFSNILWC